MYAWYLGFEPTVSAKFFLVADRSAFMWDSEKSNFLYACLDCKGTVN